MDLSSGVVPSGMHVTVPACWLYHLVWQSIGQLSLPGMPGAAQAITVQEQYSPPGTNVSHPHLGQTPSAHH